MARQMVLVPMEEYQVDHGQKSENAAALDRQVILSAIPKNYRNRATSLLNHIDADPQQRLQWNGRGELIYKSRTIHGSHITDLIKNSQRPYVQQPVGEEEFRKGLKELNIPVGLLTVSTAPKIQPKLKWASVC